MSLADQRVDHFRHDLAAAVHLRAVLVEHRGCRARARSAALGMVAV